MKNLQYFPHEFDATNDMRLQKLIMKMGYEALGFYWTIVEALYRQDGMIELNDCDSIAFGMRTDTEKIKQLIDLVFEKNEKYFWSNAVLSNLKVMKEKSKKAKHSARKRWNRQSKPSDANALPTDSDGNAKKENKRKKIKENKKEVREQKFPISYLSNLPEQDIEEFHKQFLCSRQQVREKAHAIIDWCESEGKRKKNYKSTLSNWLRKDFGERPPVKKAYSPTDELPKLTPEQAAEEKKKSEAALEKVRSKHLFLRRPKHAN